MRLSSRTEYALLALLYLARLEEGVFAHGQEISDQQEIPMRFLQQILHALKHARIVKSVKGKAGGYALQRPAHDISIAEVVRLFDGPLAPSRTVSQFFREETPIARERAATKLLREVRDFVANKLENTYLSDLA